MTKRILLLTAIFSMGTGAFAQSQNATAETSSNDALEALTQASARIESGKRIMINNLSNVRLYKSLDGQPQDNTVALKPQTEFEVLEMSNDGRVARIGIDTDNASMSDLFVSVEDLERSQLVEIQTVDGLEDDEVPDSGLFAGKKKKGGMTYCYRDVKNTLLKQKICKKYASGARAEQGYNILAKECAMVKVGKADPKKLPTYSVCVSGGGRPCGGGTYCGHIAVKMPNGTWFGAGTHKAPYLGNSSNKSYKKRYVIGCLKPKK